MHIHNHKLKHTDNVSKIWPNFTKTTQTRLNITTCLCL